MKVIYDLFPAKIRVCVSENVSDEEYENIGVMTRVPGSRLVDSVRVILTDVTIMIAADSENGPMLSFARNTLKSRCLLRSQNPTEASPDLRPRPGKSSLWRRTQTAAADLDFAAGIRTIPLIQRMTL